MKLGVSFVAAGILSLLASNAHAALTSSEKAQLRDYVAAAGVENASAVRTMIARTDHTPEESAEALTDAVAPVSWTDKRGMFLLEVLNGSGSEASRPVLFITIVKAVLGRADAIYQHEAASLEKPGTHIHAELVALYGFIDVLANLGSPTFTNHDSLKGVPPATYDAAAKLLKDHIEKDAKYLKGGDAIPSIMARVRAQAQVAMIDMMPDGLTRRVEAADRLGLKGARKTMLTEWGTLFADDGTLDEAHLEKVRSLLTRMPGARQDLSLVFYGPTSLRQGLRARGAVAHVVGGNDSWTLGGTAPATFDPALATITHDLAVIEAGRALHASPSLQAQVATDAVATSGDPNRVLGKPRAPSAEYILAAAISSLMIDAPRSIDLAVTRFNGGQPQTAALVSDALAVIGSFATDGKADLGKAGAFASATSFKKGTNDVIAQVMFDGHMWNFDRQGATDAVVGIRKDGAAVTKK